MRGDFFFTAGKAAEIPFFFSVIAAGAEGAAPSAGGVRVAFPLRLQPVEPDKLWPLLTHGTRSDELAPAVHDGHRVLTGDAAQFGPPRHEHASGLVERRRLARRRDVLAYGIQEVVEAWTAEAIVDAAVVDASACHRGWRILTVVALLHVGELCRW